MFVNFSCYTPGGAAANVDELESTSPITQDARTWMFPLQVYNYTLHFKLRANRVIQQCHWWFIVEKIGLQKRAEFAQNSRKWLAEFTFLAQNSDIMVKYTITKAQALQCTDTEYVRICTYIRKKIDYCSSSSSSSSRNEYYLGGVIALLLQDHRTMSTKSVRSSQYMVTDQHWATGAQINQSINQSWIYIARTRKASNALVR